MSPVCAVVVVVVVVMVVMVVVPCSWRPPAAPRIGHSLDTGRQRLTRRLHQTISPIAEYTSTKARLVIYPRQVTLEEGVSDQRLSMPSLSVNVARASLSVGLRASCPPPTLRTGRRAARGSPE
ncbi:hypothetical protein E2C01_003324 [Portunus trituberculatus]|uniref:Uncharacterized protein n=1 Tax=Portunus trituberculatus TaxID=210409 RepID=A0A5B7CNE9_PORTR|nr:hypothetical protein [Portunus trituberculatus]